MSIEAIMSEIRNGNPDAELIIGDYICDCGFHSDGVVVLLVVSDESCDEKVVLRPDLFFLDGDDIVRLASFKKTCKKWHILHVGGPNHSKFFGTEAMAILGGRTKRYSNYDFVGETEYGRTIRQTISVFNGFYRRLHIASDWICDTRNSLDS